MKQYLFKSCSFVTAFIVLLGMSFSACSDDDEGKVISSIEVSDASIIINRLGVTPYGTTPAFTVFSNVYWIMSIEQDEEAWLSSDRYGGNGETEIVLTADENEGTPRTATLVFVCLDGTTERVSVTQNSTDETVYHLWEDMGDSFPEKLLVNLYSEWSKLGIGSMFTRYTGVDAFLDNANPSTGYEGASGGNNILLENPQASYVFGRVETRNTSYFKLTFGVYAPQVMNKDDLKLFISSEGEYWTKLDFTCNASNGWGIAEAKFKLTEVPSVYFKIEIGNQGGFRIDDIQLLEDVEEEGEEVIFQQLVDDGTPEGYVYFEENFDWIAVETFGGTNAFPTNELSIIHNQLTPEQLDTITKYGWTQQLRYTYLRVGLMKMGRAANGSDLISPSLPIQPGYKVNVALTFDASIYASNGGTPDLDGIKIEVMGEGTINSLFNTVYALDVGVWSRQNEAAAEETITATIYGATTQTKIRIMAGVEDSEIAALGKANRFFVDNFKIAKIGSE